MKPLAVLAVLLALTACATEKPSLSESVIEAWPQVKADGVTVRYKAGDVDRAAAELVAQQVSLVRSAVADELALAPPASPPPYAEVLLYRDAGWGQDRWLVTHAVILERPLRVRIPCALPEDDQDAERIVARIRGTVAHEIAEATVLTRVPILDPYLRWMHDGIAESVEYRVLLKLDPRAASDTLTRYEQYAREARAPQIAISWVDLSRWRQLPDWIVNSDVLLQKSRALRLDDLQGSLRRLAEKRVSFQERWPDQLEAFDALLEMLSSAWAREQLPCGEGEADPRPRSGQFLCYDASFCLWLELERAHPGLTAQALKTIAARREPVLRSNDVVKIVSDLAGEDVKPRLQRFTLDRLEGVLAAERRRAH